MYLSHPADVRIVEVGPRDGLQNEPAKVPLQTKVELIERLAACGIQIIESGSFVSPRWIPQMGDSAEVFKQIQRRSGVHYTALTPNLEGFERARAAQVSEVAVFASASETFSQKNINCSVDESIARYEEVCRSAREAGTPVRGYVSCALGCPYEGPVAPAAVADTVLRLLEIGCYEVSIGDTIGIGTPVKVQEVISACLQDARVDQLAVHFHDSYGQSLANILAALQLGIATVDSSVAGLGGCPYASGASGNVATEDVLFMLHGMGIVTGIDLEALLETSDWICNQLQRPNGSRVAQARAGAAQKASEQAG